MKKIFFLTFVLLFGRIAFSQELIIHRGAKGPFLTHTVAPKENFYSLGRLYNIPPKEGLDHPIMPWKEANTRIINALTGQIISLKDYWPLDK